MGYLSDNIPVGSNYISCSELYLFKVVIQPQFASDLDLQNIVKDVIPDIEEWQFSGRRRCPTPPGRGRARPSGRAIHPSTYAQNSRKTRPFTSEVVFAFHTEEQRLLVTTRLTSLRFKFRIEDEPTSSPSGGDIVVILLP